jgi:hypothetical protein
MAGDKTRIIYGLLAKKETTYGTFVAPSVATDGVPVAEFPEVTPGYGIDGARGPAPGTSGQLRRTAPQAPIVTGTPFKIESRGAGAAYSGAVVPPEHAILQACGLDAVGSFTGGAEKYTYTRTPGPGGYSSVSLELYTEGEKIPVNGVYGDLVYEVENGRPALWTIDWKGRLNAAPSADVATAKTIVYSSVLPPLAAPLVLTFNGITSLVVEKLTWRLNRQRHDRVKGQFGQHPGRTAPELVILCERPLLTALNFWSEWSGGTPRAASFDVGTTQYNRDKWTFPALQVVDVKPQGDEARSLLEVTCQCTDTTPIANDGFQLVKD